MENPRTNLCSFRLEVSQGNSDNFLDKTFACELQTLNWMAAMKTHRQTNTAQEKDKDFGITRNSKYSNQDSWQYISEDYCLLGSDTV
jgi:hypothetical protein